MRSHVASISILRKSSSIHSVSAYNICHLLFLQMLLSFSCASYADLYEDGLNAFGAENYSEAHDLWKPLAEKGDTAAQYYLGIMYANGQGVKQDVLMAYAWYSIAAEVRGFAEEIRDDIEKTLSLVQREEAKRLIEDIKRNMQSSVELSH